MMSHIDDIRQPVAIIANAVYTTRQAAIALQVSVAAVRRACSEGRLQAGRGLGSWRIRGKALLEWATDPGESGSEPPEPVLTESDLAELLDDLGNDDE